MMSSLLPTAIIGMIATIIVISVFWKTLDWFVGLITGD